nr:hypothetical protein [Psychrobacter sp. PraFG1]UNK04888.1 hypothetical protein MN210_12245 [Psychrobacter sp. PraFG1]
MVQQLYLEDLKVGDKWISGEVSLSEAEIKDFAKDYDPQPYHLDNERARDTFLVLWSPVGGRPLGLPCV